MENPPSTRANCALSSVASCSGGTATLLERVFSRGSLCGKCTLDARDLHAQLGRLLLRGHSSNHLGVIEQW